MGVSRNIFIFDVENKKLFKSLIHRPFGEIDGKSPFKGIIMNNHNSSLLILCGYIRRMYNGLISNDIVNLIHSMVMDEYAYLLCQTTGKHCKISLDLIMKYMVEMLE